MRDNFFFQDGTASAVNTGSGKIKRVDVRVLGEECRDGFLAFVVIVIVFHDTGNLDGSGGEGVYKSTDAFFMA